MMLYKFFEQEYIGKKKHLWTFIAVERKKQGRRVYYVVECLCACGRTSYYSPDYCLSYAFPYACKKCRIWPKEKMKYKIDNEIRFVELQEIKEENNDLVLNYENFYKEYYRD